MVPPRRKKWTEAEEKTLIDKYDELVSNGTLAKMRTREKKFKPIALYVNSVHHTRDPVAYPWHWTWKDVSTKVQNMRHQYLLVKQKIRKPIEAVKNFGSDGEVEEFDWVEGLTHWSNFLRYKEVFGDVPIACNTDAINHSMAALDERDTGEAFGSHRPNETVGFGQTSHLCCNSGATGLDGSDSALFMGFDYGEEEADKNYSGRDVPREEDAIAGFVAEEVDPNGYTLRKKRKALKGLEKKTWTFISKQLAQLKEMEARYEQREKQREREILKRENLWMEAGRGWEQKIEETAKEREDIENIREESRRQIIEEWDTILKDNEERERRRREEHLIEEREWEDRLSRRRLEWTKRIDERLSQHRVEMDQIQTRILHEQQNLTSQLLGIISQWTGNPTELSNHASASNHYLSPVMQNMHHVSGMLHADARVDDDTQDDGFIVDG